MCLLRVLFYWGPCAGFSVMKGLADVMDTILLVVPCKNEERAISLFHEEVSRVFSTMRQSLSGRYSWMMDRAMDDGRPARSCRARRPGMLSVPLAQFRQGSRALCWFDGCRGGRRRTGGGMPFAASAASRVTSCVSSLDRFFVATLDADLQDPPSLIPEMYRSLASGEYDCAATRRVSRKGEPFLRTLGRKASTA